MADMSKLEARIKMLEARREKGESVPELDALYSQMDTATSKAYEESSKKLSGDYEGKSASKGAGKKAKPKMDFSYTQTMKEVMVPKNDSKSRAERTNPMGDTYKKGGMTASARADGIAQRGKTRGRIV